MAADPEIRVSVTAVTGEAAAALKQFADQQSAIQQRLVAAQYSLTNATNAYKEALKQLVPAGAAANEVNAASLKILNEYKLQVDAAKASVTEQATALKALKPPMLEATEQTELFAFAQSEASAQTGHLTQNLYAAQGASRLLSGNVPVRAFERFLSIIPGVGAALGAAFPIIGAVALIQIIGEGIEKIHKMKQEADEAADYIDRSFRKMGDSLREANDQLLTQTAHLESQLDRAFKKPGENGAAEAFYEAASAADKLGISLDRDLEKLEELTSAENKKANIGFWSSLFSGKAETGDTSEFIKKQVDAIRKVNDDYSDMVGRAAESGNKANLASAQQDQLVALQKAYKTATDAIVSDLKTVENKQEDFKEGGWGEDQTAKINLLRGALNQLALEQKNIGQQFANEQLNQQVVQAKALGSKKENYADELAAEQLAHGKSLGATVLYWEGVVAKTGKYHEQLLRAEEEFRKNLNEKGKFRAVLDRNDAKEENNKPPAASADLQNIADYYNRTGEAYAHYREQIARGNQILSENEARLASIRVTLEEQSGAISKVTADHRLGAIQAKEYADRIAELKQQMDALKASLPQAEAEGKGGQQSAQIQALQNQIYQLQGQAANAGAANKGKTTEDLAAPYIKATEMINGAWLQMQNKLIFGTRNISQAFANMGVSLLESVAQSFEKMLVRQLQYEIQSRIAHQTSNTIKLASDAQSAAAGDALNKQSALKEEFINAKVAATAAFKGVMSHVPPPLNFILAPVAAAAAFAGTLAVGAFEKGGIIGGPTLALMGESGQEAVLPNKLTNLLLNAANSGGGNTSNSSSTTVHSTANFNGITDRNFREMARRNAEHVYDAAHSAVRSGKRRVA
jgi:hypothetical protein